MARAWVFGDDISTDAIIPGRYLVKREPGELAKHAMEGADPEFARKVQPRDVIIAGKNFGCGSSREHAPIAIKAAGVSAVVAESFAGIFYRNAINQGLLVLTCPNVSKGFKSEDKVEIDVKMGIVRNLSTGERFNAEPLPRFVLDILEAGGLLPHLKRKLSSGRTS